MPEKIYIEDSIQSLKPNADVTVLNAEKDEDSIIVFHDDTTLTREEIFAERDRLQEIENAK